MPKATLGLAFVLFITGCSLFKQPIIPTADPLDVFQGQVQQFDASLSLENDLQNLFANKNSAPVGTYVYPMPDYSTLRTKKMFGQYVASDSGDSFSGYHTGDDIEVTDVTAEVPFFSLADATVLKKEIVSGYGGVIILEFVDGLTVYHALYGHVDLNSITMVVGDKVTAGEQLGMLGDDGSSEADGERKHLHFAIYPFVGTVLYAGYTDSDVDLNQWVNPADFLRAAKATQPAV
ncbi:MAG: metalloendopeptidase-like protein membrane protein [uncultured bacterium]|nr:MAG: metalloendopeptidase-like protein membrane protein [uncultured bacterium]